MNAKDILTRLEQLASDSNSVFIPEFTWGDLRIDAVILDPRKRQVRGFEVKISRSDFLKDHKWQAYSQFCSSLTLVCPDGLIEVHEVPSGFGLAWLYSDGHLTYRRPGRQFNRRDLAWTWRYLEVIETELPRLVAELRMTRADLAAARRNSIAQEVS